MIDLIADLDKLGKHIKNSEKTFRNSIIDYYKKEGESQGYEIVEGSKIIVNGVDYGEIDLVWVEPKVTFNLEFGLKKDIYKHIFLNHIAQPDTAVFILSSNSKFKPKDLVEMLVKTPFLKHLRNNTVIIDLAKMELVLS